MTPDDYTEAQPVNVIDPAMTDEDWFVAHQMKGGKSSFNRGTSLNTKFRGAAVQGADSGEAMMNSRSIYAKMTPAARMEYLRTNGAPAEVMAKMQAAAPTESAQLLPPRLQKMPNAPMPGANASETAPARFAAMVGNQDATRTAGGNAVKAKLAEQVTNPAATVDKAIATRRADQAKMGITDLGGANPATRSAGNKVMSNKYGVGSITTMNPAQFANRPPAIINDEKGAVDVTAMKGAATMPYKGPSNAMAMTKPEITAANNAAVASPATAQRLATDRARQVGAYTAQTAPLRVAAKQWMASLKPKAEKTAAAPAPPPMLKRPDANAPKRNPVSQFLPA